MHEDDDARHQMRHTDGVGAIILFVVNTRDLSLHPLIFPRVRLGRGKGTEVFFSVHLRLPLPLALHITLVSTGAMRGLKVKSLTDFQFVSLVVGRSAKSSLSVWTV
ncbi:hypothetical protein D3C71_1705970 [compost metagenome]